MRGVAIVQARMGSSRLPGKVLRRICGRTVLEHVLRRVQAAAGLEAVAVATSVAAADDAVASEAQRCGAHVFRGSEDDVLERFCGAARELRAQAVVRITADCPLLDPRVVERVYTHFLQAPQADYVSNTLVRTYPRGLDVEVVRAVALELACAQARQPYEREHVTPYFYGHPERFALENVAREGSDLSALRWTLDVAEDLRFITAVYEALWQEDALFTTSEILALLRRRPELTEINRHVRQKTLGA
ncbi:acylneuraminate cytidylyltransferase [bacterium]|nr:MAG: acylneuraminate cytidylyltransferase [bacterium]